jgi:hypothetical protein
MHICQAFNVSGTTYRLQSSATGVFNVTRAWQTLLFAPAVNVAAGGTEYIAYRNSLGLRQSIPNFYTSPISNAPLKYINSWYQYPSAGTAFLSYPAMVSPSSFSFVLALPWLRC